MLFYLNITSKSVSSEDKRQAPQSRRSSYSQRKSIIPSLWKLSFLNAISVSRAWTSYMGCCPELGTLPKPQKCYGIGIVKSQVSFGAWVRHQISSTRSKTSINRSASIWFSGILMFDVRKYGPTNDAEECLFAWIQNIDLFLNVDHQ